MMRVVSFRPMAKGTLKGFFSLKLASCLTLHGCAWHQKRDRQWVGLPGRPWKTDSGETRWSPVVEVDESSRESFQKQALAAVRDYVERDRGAA